MSIRFSWDPFKERLPINSNESFKGAGFERMQNEVFNRPVGWGMGEVNKGKWALSTVLHLEWRSRRAKPSEISRVRIKGRTRANHWRKWSSDALIWKSGHLGEIQNGVDHTFSGQHKQSRQEHKTETLSQYHHSKTLQVKCAAGIASSISARFLFSAAWLRQGCVGCWRRRGRPRRQRGCYGAPQLQWWFPNLNTLTSDDADAIPAVCKHTQQHQAIGWNLHTHIFSCVIQGPLNPAPPKRRVAGEKRGKEDGEAKEWDREQRVRSIKFRGNRSFVKKRGGHWNFTAV